MGNFSSPVKDIAPGKPEETPSYRWFSNFESEIVVVADIYEIIMAFACTLFNVYFLAVICLVKEVRQWKYYPVAIQSFFDLISCGLVLFYKTLQDALVRMKDNEDRFYYGGELAKWYRGSVLGRDSVFSFCVQNFVLDIANDYSTAPCLLIMACERYILVCHPTTAKQYLTNRARKYICITLTILILSLISWSAKSTFVIYFDMYHCDKSFYNDFVTRYVVDGILFFLLPALICVVLYSLVGFRLKKVRQNANRNKNLTVAFLLTSLLWTVLWLPNYAVFVYEALFDDDPEVVKYYEGEAHIGHSVPYYILQALARTLKYTYSLINPIIVIFTIRTFQKPLSGLKKKCSSWMRFFFSAGWWGTHKKADGVGTGKQIIALSIIRREDF